MSRIRTIAIAGATLAGAGVVCGAATAGIVATRLVRRVAQRLRGKTVLITGGSRGLGLALAHEFGRRGVRLVLTARDPYELERARHSLLQRGSVANEDDLFAIPADLRNEEEAARMIEQATQHFGQIDILVNNAGIIAVGPVENQSVADFHQAMESNFFSMVHCTLAVAPQMLRRRSGTVVNITSIGGKVAVPHLLPYTASKFAAVGFSEGLHAELRSKGVHVLTVCPGLMRTGSHLQALFTGDAPREYRWFSLAATLPVVATSAACAARRIVRAVVLRETEIAITPQAILASRLANLAPELVARAAAVGNRLLPSATPLSSAQRRGAELRDRELLPASTLGWAAARRYNQSGN